MPLTHEISRHVAVDLGAESGRIMLGTLSQDHVVLEEIHRFRTEGEIIGGSLRWNVMDMWSEILRGLQKLQSTDEQIQSISSDSWGVDYVLLHQKEPMLIAPFHYRDQRCNSAVEHVRKLANDRDIFDETGIQFMPINSLYQLMDDLKCRPALLWVADGFLSIGDYVNWLLSGVRCIDTSQASTTQLYNPRARKWSESLISTLGIPRHLFPTIVDSGTILGPIQSNVVNQVGLHGCAVITTCTHDTAAAIAGIPALTRNWAFISSGTWSLVGMECDRLFINDACRKFNFTNEIGWANSVRLLKNVVGLWIVQECRKFWKAEGHHFSYETLTKLAEQASPMRSFIKTSDTRFLSPGNMPEKIQEYCVETRQSVPRTHGEIIRCILESLALSYQDVFRQLCVITESDPRCIHVVGGGAKNDLLCQMTANALCREVISGPIEATAVGNVLTQAIALGKISDLEHLRKIVSNSFKVRSFAPRNTDVWLSAVCRYQYLP